MSLSHEGLGKLIFYATPAANYVWHDSFVLCDMTHSHDRLGTLIFHATPATNYV